MRNRPATLLCFALKIPVAVFLISATSFLLHCAIFDAAIPAERALMITSFLMGAIEFGQVGESLFNDVRNIARGLPLPTMLWHTETNHGGTINEVKAGICEEPVEYLAVFTMFGIKLIEITNFQPSNIYRCKAVEELCKKHSGIVTVHNHPGRDDFPFSPADIRTAMRRGQSRTIVVTQSSVYEMILPRKYSEKEANQACAIMENEIGLFSCGRKRQMRACERVAAEFGMTFKQSARRN